MRYNFNREYKRIKKHFKLFLVFYIIYFLFFNIYKPLDFKRMEKQILDVNIISTETLDNKNYIKRVIDYNNETSYLKNIDKFYTYEYKRNENYIASREYIEAIESIDTIVGKTFYKISSFFKGDKPYRNIDKTFKYTTDVDIEKSSYLENQKIYKDMIMKTSKPQMIYEKYYRKITIALYSYLIFIFIITLSYISLFIPKFKSFKFKNYNIIFYFLAVFVILNFTNIAVRNKSFINTSKINLNKTEILVNQDKKYFNKSTTKHFLEDYTDNLRKVYIKERKTFDNKYIDEENNYFMDSEQLKVLRLYTPNQYNNLIIYKHILIINFFLLYQFSFFLIHKLHFIKYRKKRRRKRTTSQRKHYKKRNKTNKTKQEFNYAYKKAG